MRAINLRPSLPQSIWELRIENADRYGHTDHSPFTITTFRVKNGGLDGTVGLSPVVTGTAGWKPPGLGG